MEKWNRRWDSLFWQPESSEISLICFRQWHSFNLMDWWRWNQTRKGESQKSKFPQRSLHRSIRTHPKGSWAYKVKPSAPYLRATASLEEQLDWRNQRRPNLTTRWWSLILSSFIDERVAIWNSQESLWNCQEKEKERLKTCWVKHKA